MNMPVLILAVCDTSCENGGTCTAPDTCECLDGYSGDQCENGMIYLLYEYFHVFPFPYTLCLAICDPACENGGTCTAPNTCDCPEGYSGNQCQRGMF